MLLVRNVETLCPATDLSGRRDLWVKDGTLHLSDPGGKPEISIDGEGLLAVPGFIELHAHLRDPGFPASETIATGLAAALAGGYTAVFAMANTRPPNDDPRITRGMIEAARACGSPVRLYPVAAATLGLLGREACDYPPQRKAGAAAVSDDGRPVLDDEVMAACMAGAARAGLPIFDHATHGPEPGGGIVHAGPAALARGLAGLPREEEDRLVRRDIALSKRSGHGIHIQHLSTLGAIEAVREARASGVPVTAEAAPHHLLLTDEDATGPDFKMNPPLREERDRRALVEALLDGTVDAVATDHAPHAPELKARGLPGAPFGVIGMESAFPALFTGLVLPGALPLDRLVRLLTSGPASVGRVPGGRLEAGVRVELNLLDLATAFRFDSACLRSRSRNCPFLGRTLRGRVVATVAGDRLHVHRPERIRSEPL
jgi:dihydroorotase